MGNPTSPNGIVEFHCHVKRDGNSWEHFKSCMEIIDNILQTENVKHIDLEKWIKIPKPNTFSEDRLKPDILIDNKRAIEVQNIFTGSKKIYKDILEFLGISLTVVINVFVPESMINCTEIRISSYSDEDENKWNYLVPKDVIRYTPTTMEK